ncbi:MAG TPA: ABC transporter permease [Terriglobia bacterium]|nr:ABC transporter permease [Terriglobia bacterium]
MGHLKKVVRRLLRTPAFTIPAIITLTIGIGANTAIFSVLEGVILKPLPYPQPEQLVSVALVPRASKSRIRAIGPADYFVFRDQSRTFQDIGLYRSGAANITGFAQPERVDTLNVTYGTLSALDVAPLLGRLFTRQDDSPAAPPSAILTYFYWRRKFGGDSSIVGRTIIVDGTERLIIGVMPRGFHFLDESDIALILPLQLNRNRTYLGDFSYEAIARLRNGVTIAEATSDVNRLLPIVLRSFAVPPNLSLDFLRHARFGPSLRPLQQEVIGSLGKLLWFLTGSIGLVLLMACANVANLFLVRTNVRQQELAIRIALGATFQHVARDLLFESLVIGLSAGAFGLLFAYTATHLIVSLSPVDLPRLRDVGIDRYVLLFNFCVAALTSVFFGLIPLLRYIRSRPGMGVQEIGRAPIQNRRQRRLQDTFVAAQVAIAFILLFCSGLIMRSFISLSKVNPGFVRPGDVQTFRIAVPSSEVPNNDRLMRMEQQIRDNLAALPSVSSVGISSDVPMDGTKPIDPIFIDGRQYKNGQVPPLCWFHYVSPGYLAAAGIPLIAGRNITWDDTYKRIPVALVSENLARAYWGDPLNALRSRIRPFSSDVWCRIIGVVGDVHGDGVGEGAPLAVYWPLLNTRTETRRAGRNRNVAFVIRSPLSGSEAFMSSVRKAVWSVDGNLPIANFHTLKFYYKMSLARTSFALVMLSIAGGIALVLGVFGLYGVTAYAVSQRTREIAIRMALGAEPTYVVTMFIRHGLAVAVIGIVGGFLGAVAIAQFMSSLLFHIGVMDPGTCLAVTICVLLVALLATYLPSRRAAYVSPVEGLRFE